LCFNKRLKEQGRCLERERNGNLKKVEQIFGKENGVLRIGRKKETEARFILELDFNESMTCRAMFIIFSEKQLLAYSFMREILNKGFKLKINLLIGSYIRCIYHTQEHTFTHTHAHLHTHSHTLTNTHTY
jgi:hypothetical protein